MSQQALDDGGLARQALSSAVASHGISVLSDPKALGDVTARLLPGLPRERSMLIAAADADVASLLRQHLHQQHGDPAAAVQQAARELAGRTALEPPACAWVTAEFARVLGYPEGLAATQPVPPSAPPWVPQQAGGYPPTQVAYGGAGAAAPPGAPPPGAQPALGVPPPPGVPPAPGVPSARGAPPPGWWQVPPGQVPPGQAPPGQMPPGQAPPGPVPWPGAQAAGGGPPRRSGWRKSAAVATAAGVVVALAVYVATAAAAHLFPFASPRTAASPGPVTQPKAHPSPRPPSAAASPGAGQPAGTASLVQLLPAVLDDPKSQCSVLNPPYHWSMSGVVQALQCLEVPGLPNGAVYAYQLDNASDYGTAWLNYNQWWGFNGSDAGTSCPPSDVTGEGTEAYDNHYFPAANGQVLECEEVTSNQPAYTWTMPTEYTFIVAQAAPGTSFAALASWWTDNAVPAAAPTPPPP